jgi:hypothetical protein
MNIVAGLAGLKAAADLAKATRDAAKAGTLKPDEFAGRVGEIYDYIIDSKDALVEAKDELQQLRDENKGLRDATAERNAIRQELLAEDNAYFRVVEGKKQGPFCSTCWDDTFKLVRLTYQGTGRVSGFMTHVYTCTLHSKTQVPMSKDYSKAQSS